MYTDGTAVVVFAKIPVCNNNRDDYNKVIVIIVAVRRRRRRDRKRLSRGRHLHAARDDG